MKTAQRRALERVVGKHLAEGPESQGQGLLNRAHRRAEASRVRAVRAALKVELRRLKPGQVAEVDLNAIYTHPLKGGRDD